MEGRGKLSYQKAKKSSVTDQHKKSSDISEGESSEDSTSEADSDSSIEYEVTTFSLSSGNEFMQHPSYDVSSSSVKPKKGKSRKKTKKKKKRRKKKTPAKVREEPRTITDISPTHDDIPVAVVTAPRTRSRSIGCQTNISVDTREEIFRQKCEKAVKHEVETIKEEVIQQEEDDKGEDEHETIDQEKEKIGLETCDNSDDDAVSVYSSLPFLPSIGPPNILKYQRESESFVPTPDDIESRMEAEQGQHAKLQACIFSGPCHFCGKNILPLPTNEELSTVPIHKLFCCQQYEKFIRLFLSGQYEKLDLPDETIDIMPKENLGTKAARRAARERALERLREREAEKLRLASMKESYFASPRQAKVIQYTLSSPKYLKEGWTIQPPPPTPKQEEVIYDSLEVDVNTTFLQKAKAFYRKFYDDGKTFLVIYPDGSGACFYPSGNLAVLIITVEEGKYSYLIYRSKSEPDYTDTGLLGIFEPSGFGFCYFPEGNARIVLNPYGGMQSDKKGKRKKKWNWNAENWHSHAPPLHPICVSLNKNLAVRLKNQSDIVLTFTCTTRSVRFNVGANIKTLKPIVPKKTTTDTLTADLKKFKQTTGALFSKIENALRFPNSPRLNKLSLPAYVQERRKGKQDSAKLPNIRDSEHSVIVN